MTNNILEVENLTVKYGHVTVIRDLSISIQEGEIAALIGANAAGKSSIINAICGLLPDVSCTSIKFCGERIDDLKSFDRVSRGLIQVSEGRLLFGNLTVMENLEMGAYLQRGKGTFDKSIEYVFSLFPRLKERRKQLAKTLSGGEQQMVAIARGLMGQPKMLILDEPSWGLAPKLITEVFETVRKINMQGVTILLVEQQIKRCLKVAGRAYVLENGEFALEGKSEDLLNNDHVRRAYLGM